MTRYQHKKGVIRKNALEALLHDPLFKTRIESNQKGKGSYKRKEKHGKKDNWEASGKESFTTGLLALNDILWRMASSVYAIRCLAAYSAVSVGRGFR